MHLTKTIADFLLIIAFYGVLSYTVLGRTPFHNHTFIFTTYNSESTREMFMNALLYYPLGLSLTVLIGPWSIPIALLSSTLIESWQYFAGTGVAQGTDVIMNTLGAAIGTMLWVIVKYIVMRQKRSKTAKIKGDGE